MAVALLTNMDGTKFVLNERFFDCANPNSRDGDPSKGTFIQMGYDPQHGTYKCIVVQESPEQVYRAFLW